MCTGYLWILLPSNTEFINYKDPICYGKRNGIFYNFRQLTKNLKKINMEN
jgi:hypothetical protein